MPDNLRNFGTSLGVKLPIPGVPTGTAETGGTGGVLGGVFKMIPGLSGDQPPQQEPPQEQPQQEPPPGLVPMPPRAVDYKAVAKLVASLKGQGGEDALVGLPIPVTVTGSP